MPGQNFDRYMVDYRKTDSGNVKLSGADSCYFSEYKVLELKERFKDRNISRILDLGCGDGTGELFFIKYFPDAKVWGIDISLESIRIAGKKNIPNSSFCQYDGNTIPFNNHDFVKNQL